MKNHEKCIDKVRKQIMEANPELKYVHFDLVNIVSWDGNKRSKYFKTGQRTSSGYNHKKKDGTIVQKEQKSFVAHEFCPFCGEKYID